jgi:hypothetical protein
LIETPDKDRASCGISAAAFSNRNHMKSRFQNLKSHVVGIKGASMRNDREEESPSKAVAGLAVYATKSG